MKGHIFLKSISAANQKDRIFDHWKLEFLTDRRSIASLAGLAPIAKDSGYTKGQRRIGKGRPVVRAALYIAALHASKWDETFKAFRQRLEDKGKTPKQAICAVARKLLTILNAMMKSGQKYQSKPA